MVKSRGIYVSFAVALLHLAGIQAQAAGGGKNWLQECAKKQVASAPISWVEFAYRESQYSLYHSPEPWQTLHTGSQGHIWYGQDKFMQLDSVKGRDDKYMVSKLSYNPSELLSQAYWSGKVSGVTQNELQRQPLELARYTPGLLIGYFLKHHAAVNPKTDADHAVYSVVINQMPVELWIRKRDCLADKILYMENDDLRGDVTTTMSYDDYKIYGGLSYAGNIIIEKIHGVRDTVNMQAVTPNEIAPTVLEKPADYKIEDEEKTVPSVSVEKVTEHRYNITLPHTDTRVTLLEFKDFFVIIDVPLSSENGELVLQEIRKINPAKPVKYYAFGHHHPWYIGGVRPFIRNGTTVLCTSDDQDYLSFLATAPHTLKPDSLQQQPTSLKTELIDETKTISDGSFELQIFHVGIKSKHTKDYMLFYLPSEKLLIEDDLAWISAKDSLKKANRGQTALYQSIKELGIPVSTIDQHWPWGERYGIKSEFSFAELEESANMK